MFSPLFGAVGIGFDQINLVFLVERTNRDVAAARHIRHIEQFLLAETAENALPTLRRNRRHGDEEREANVQEDVGDYFFHIRFDATKVKRFLSEKKDIFCLLLSVIFLCFVFHKKGAAYFLIRFSIKRLNFVFEKTVRRDEF